ncbi:hypothetical protein HQQ94_19895 [Shewanella sp. VB17]|uniref:hypothetical protein n=1 Tax=Shewanella sp. VB17 TaxID=2739432 RepID=UPI0015670A61|nr:hypothetical protein [Shewanella sp. VB17]NRD75440.1 hypothetical protein [Shewanella sp. VB17]
MTALPANPLANNGIIVGDETFQIHSRHVYFPSAANKNKIGVSIHITVDAITTHSRENFLNFFALQVNFNNNTAAHGGFQSHQVNWGGLANHGGGVLDYNSLSSLQAAQVDILKIQNAPDEIRNQPFDYVVGKEYIYEIKRLGREKFSAGQEVKVIGGGVPVTPTVERNLYVWEFTVTPADGNGPSLRSVLYNSAPCFDFFCVWNEIRNNEDQRTSWSNPSYTQENGTVVTPTDWSRF